MESNSPQEIIDSKADDVRKMQSKAVRFDTAYVRCHFAAVVATAILGLGHFPHLSALVMAFEPILVPLVYVGMFCMLASPIFFIGVIGSHHIAVNGSDTNQRNDFAYLAIAEIGLILGNTIAIFVASMM